MKPVTVDHTITPTPTDEEAAAIAAALVMTWPRPPSAADDDAATSSARWRFSGRPWYRPDWTPPTWSR